MLAMLLADPVKLVIILCAISVIVALIKKAFKLALSVSIIIIAICIVRTWLNI